MAEAKGKAFWEKENKRLWKLFDKLQKEVDSHKFPLNLLPNLKEESYTLYYFFMGKIFHDLFPQEKIKQLKSEVTALGYAPDKGVHAWFKNRKKKREFYKTRIRPLSERRNKKDAEMACVKMFYENKGRCLKDSQIKRDEPENSPIDVAIEENGKEAYFQVTHLQREAVGVLLRGWSYFGKVKTIEEIKNNIEKVIMDKEPKGRNDIILLLDALLPLPDVKLLERAVTELSINSSFREIYIVTSKRNVPAKCG